MSQTPLGNGQDRGIAEAVAGSLNGRKRAALRFRLYGLLGILIALGFLVFLFSDITGRALSAFRQTHIQLTVDLDASRLSDPASTGRTEQVYGPLIEQSLARLLDIPPSDRRQIEEARGLISANGHFELRNHVTENEDLIGQEITFWMPANWRVDQFQKGKIDVSRPESQGLISRQQVAWVRALEERGDLKAFTNTYLLTRSASSQPELSGILGALVGSLWMMGIVLVLAVPIGVGASIYLQEFARKSWLTDTIEVNINNLAAVPSIVFGILGLALFINTLGLQRAWPLVGGLVLMLMTLPTIIIATRASLRSVPPSIREGALAVGASRVQTVFHHVLPLSLPGILTGTIIGIARAMGETAPLLLVGLVSFVTSVPTSPRDDATALPGQIYLWTTASQGGFAERAAAGVLILVAVLVMMNLGAILLRQRFERRW